MLAVGKKGKKKEDFLSKSRKINGILTQDIIDDIRKSGNKKLDLSEVNNTKIGNDVRYVIDAKERKKLSFYCYEKLEGVILPKPLKCIGCYSFCDCTNLVSVEIPNSVNSICDFAFSNCSLVTVRLPDSVEIIGPAAFQFCRSLKIINMPKALKEIGFSAFKCCASLTSLELPNNGEIISIGQESFFGCGFTSLTIPGNIGTISDQAFQFCKSLVTVDILDGVSSIGNEAFHQCLSLVSVRLPDTITHISEDAFSNCLCLKDINVPKNLQNIPKVN